MAILTADHLIARKETFRRALLAAAEVATTPGHLVTSGITPAYAETGYGYVKRGQEITTLDGLTAYRVLRFTEKPNRETAERFVPERPVFLEQRHVPVTHADSILAEIARQMPN